MFRNRGQSLIGIIVVLVVVALMSGGLYLYLSKQILEISKIPGKPTEEEIVKPEGKEMVPEEVIPKEKIEKEPSPPLKEITPTPEPEKPVSPGTVSQCAALPVAQTSIITEPIIFALNESYAAKLPEWKERADRLIETVNSVFAKTTPKRFRIDKYLTYPDKEYTNLFRFPERYPEFYRTYGDRGGITYVMLIHQDGISNEELKQQYGSDQVNLAMPVWKDNRRYYFLLQGAPESWNLLILDPDPSWYYMPIHEFGHFQGVAVPEWYFYDYSDATGVEPKFKDYAIAEDPRFQNDPMAIKFGTPEQWKFNDLASQIIKMNLGREYHWEDIQHNWFTKTAKVRVVTTDGSLVEGATVKVFGAKKGCWYCFTNASGVRYGLGIPTNQPPLQTLTTDANGYAVYDGPIGEWHFNEREDTPFIAKTLKAYYGNKSGVEVVNFIDLQSACILEKKDEHVVTIILRE